jgi:pimeloyl-ACP methyl ester carboxylesterase
MPSFVRDAIDLSYTVVGSGTPVLFIHGATATGTFEWSALAEALSDGRACVLPDLRGHGGSSFTPAAMSAEAICDDLRALTARLGMARPHVIGFSFGAEMALSLELGTPGFARSLTLISPGTGQPPTYRLPPFERVEQGWAFRLRRLHDERHGPDHWRVLLRLLLADAATRDQFATSTLAAVGCPILLLSGMGDEPKRRAQAGRFADANPRARLIDIHDAGHAPHHEQPEIVHVAVRRFLDEAELRDSGPSASDSASA